MPVPKTALVTGCSPGGIGHALAIELQTRGFRVFATGRTLKKVSSLADLGIECVALTVDDPQSVAACHDEVVRLLGGQGLDYLFNNAGQGVFRPATAIDLPQCKAMFGSNVFGVIDMCQTFFPEILRAKGTIVNIGSVAGYMPLPFMSTYSASKAAMYAYSDTLRVEVAPLGVKVIHINTGSVKTNTCAYMHELDERSLWFPVKDVYDREQRNCAEAGEEPEEFVKGLAGRVLGSPKPVMWVGWGAFLCRAMLVMEHFVPFRLMAWMGNQMYKMDRIAVHSKHE